ncbi:CZB domain-containing protein [Novosphingobium sp. B 225]|uniref:CZB domain-containing protein n=1 Tax=Novosphingobium sp. B 225 TaxID=1961849 RepID=UPI000B4A7C18|nr:CZB domain-containing protein [Novosphingobium sp. B 225]
MPDDRLIREIADAITAHMVWKQRLIDAITSGQLRFSPIAAGSDRECAFGKWLLADKLDPQVKASRPYAVVQRLHTAFHRTAGKILTDVEQGRIKDAQLALSREFEAQSDLLIRALQKWRRELVG